MTAGQKYELTSKVDTFGSDSYKFLIDITSATDISLEIVELSGKTKLCVITNFDNLGEDEFLLAPLKLSIRASEINQESTIKLMLIGFKECDYSLTIEIGKEDIST